MIREIFLANRKRSAILSGMNSNKFDFEGEVIVKGYTLYVEANFKFAVDSVGHEVAPYMGFSGMSRDVYANVPQTVETIAVYTEEGEPVTDAETVREAGEAAMDYVAQNATPVNGKWR